MKQQPMPLLVVYVLAYVPDLLIAAVLAHILDGGFLLFGVLFLALKALYLVIWLKNSLWEWLWYLFWHKKVLKHAYIDSLMKNKMPGIRMPRDPAGWPVLVLDDLSSGSPAELLAGGPLVDSYLAAVMSNEAIDIKRRLLAAQELGALNYLASNVHLQEYMRIGLAFDEAIEAYSRTIRRRKKGLSADLQ
jgi:hypothetical protein